MLYKTFAPPNPAATNKDPQLLVLENYHHQQAMMISYPQRWGQNRYDMIQKLHNEVANCA